VWQKNNSKHIKGEKTRMSGTKIFILLEKTYKALTTRGMDLRCKCTIGGDGPCNALLEVHDKVVSKPSKHGRKYYLFNHYQRMRIEIENHEENGMFFEKDET